LYLKTPRRASWERRLGFGLQKLRQNCDLPHILLLSGAQSEVKSASDSLARPRRRAGVTHNVLAPRSFRSEVFGMEDRAPEVSSSTTQTSMTQSALIRRREGRGAWVLTAYGISGLALFGLLAYFFSDYIAH
jgi:hypothetical protein